jgi:hypothetical protein
MLSLDLQHEPRLKPREIRMALMLRAPSPRITLALGYVHNAAVRRRHVLAQEVKPYVRCPVDVLLHCERLRYALEALSYEGTWYVELFEQLEEAVDGFWLRCVAWCEPAMSVFVLS